MAKELKTCALCGDKYEGYGNSTWGWWEMTTGCSTQEDNEKVKSIVAATSAMQKR